MIVSSIVEETVERESPTSQDGGGWIVILYNCDCHTFDDVIIQLQRAANCTPEDAVKIAIEAHTCGRAIAFQGSADDCERTANILRSAKLQVETDRI